MAYGIHNEENAITCYLASKGVQVEPCGMFINPLWPYLGASPDGLVSSDGLVEVKCYPSIGELSPREAAALKKLNMCVSLDGLGSMTIQRNHDYLLQIQGQLNIANRSTATWFYTATAVTM